MSDVPSRRQAGLAIARRILGSRVLRAGFVLLAVALAIVAVRRQWTEVREGLRELSWPVLAGSFCFAIAGITASMLTWRAVLADLGSRLGLRRAARMFFVAQLGKYVPGAVWPVVAQMEMGRAAGVPRRRMASAFAATLLLSLATALLVASGTLPFAASEQARALRWTLLLTPVLLLLAHPQVMNRVITRALRLLRRPPLEHPLTARGVAAAGGWLSAMWLLLGLHVWLLAVDLGAPAGRALAVASGGIAIAFAVQLVLPVVPAGAGIRDAALVVVLGATLDRGDALVVALVSRLLLMVADLAAAGLAATTWRGSPGRTRHTVEGTETDSGRRLPSDVSAAEGGDGEEARGASRARRRDGGIR